jgi:negative regulator of flagellin synthesis FlgM
MGVTKVGQSALPTAGQAASLRETRQAGQSVQIDPKTTSAAAQGAELRRTERLDTGREIRKAEGAAESGAASGARADISARAREFSKAREVAASAPDVREEKIAELKRRVASGDYQVNAEAVADRMLREHALF